MLAQLAWRGDRAGTPSSPEARLEPLLAMALVPLGATLYGWHLYARTGDMLAFAHIQASWGRINQNPMVLLWQGIRDGGWPLIFALEASLGLLAAAILCVRQRIGYGAYLAAVILLPLSSSVWSIPRYVFWQPVFMLVMADCLRWRPLARLLLPLLWASYFVMIAAWLSGHRFLT